MYGSRSSTISPSASDNKTNNIEKNGKCVCSASNHSMFEVVARVFSVNVDRSTQSLEFLCKDSCVPPENADSDLVELKKSFEQIACNKCYTRLGEDIEQILPTLLSQGPKGIKILQFLVRFADMESVHAMLLCDPSLATFVDKCEPECIIALCELAKTILSHKSSIVFSAFITSRLYRKFFNHIKHKSTDFVTSVLDLFTATMGHYFKVDERIWTTKWCLEIGDLLETDDGEVKNAIFRFCVRLFSKQRLIVITHFAGLLQPLLKFLAKNFQEELDEVVKSLSSVASHDSQGVYILQYLVLNGVIQHVLQNCFKNYNTASTKFQSDVQNIIFNIFKVKLHLFTSRELEFLLQFLALAFDSENENAKETAWQTCQDLIYSYNLELYNIFFASVLTPSRLNALSAEKKLHAQEFLRYFFYSWLQHDTNNVTKVCEWGYLPLLITNIRHEKKHLVVAKAVSTAMHKSKGLIKEFLDCGGVDFLRNSFENYTALAACGALSMIKTLLSDCDSKKFQKVCTIELLQKIAEKAPEILQIDHGIFDTALAQILRAFHLAYEDVNAEKAQTKMELIANCVVTCFADTTVQLEDTYEILTEDSLFRQGDFFKKFSDVLLKSLVKKFECKGLAYDESSETVIARGDGAADIQHIADFMNCI